MIDSRNHAYEVLNYVLHKSKEREKAEIIQKSIAEIRKFGFKIDEEVFFKEICKREEGVKFMQANGITTLEVLVLKHFEFHMKYQWRKYKSINSDYDYFSDDMDSSEYLD